MKCTWSVRSAGLLLLCIGALACIFGCSAGPSAMQPKTLTSIAVTSASASIAKGRTEPFTATGTYSDGSTQSLTSQATWSSSNPSVATISTAGLASAVGLGSTTIEASVNGVNGSTGVAVTAATLQSIAVTPANPSIAAGVPEQFTAAGTYSDGSTQNLTSQATWSSSSPAIATINTEGLASAIAHGITTIQASLTGVTASTTLTVATLVSIAVTPLNPSVAAGNTIQFMAMGKFSNGSSQNVTGSVTWASSSTTAATISTTGLATGVKGGQSTTISATLGSISASTSLSVTPAALVSIAVTPTTPSVAEGNTIQFTATGTFSDGSTQNMTDSVTWASSNAAATVNSAGLAKGVTAGQSATISATEGSISGSTSLSVTLAVLVSIAVTPVGPSIGPGNTQQFTGTGKFSNGSTQDLTDSVTWASSNTSAATISATGLATGVTAGQSTTVSATKDTISGSTTLTVGDTFGWPIDTPVTVAQFGIGGAPPNDYSAYNGANPQNSSYHTGIDLCPPAGCVRGEPVYASADGVVQNAFATSDPNQSLCDGGSVSSLTNDDKFNLGNAVIIAHTNGKFTLYGHLDCVWQGISAGVHVNRGQRIGNMGNSSFGRRQSSFTPHVHFEMKDKGVLGDPTNVGLSGYTPDLPDGYGYHDARIYLFPFPVTGISPTAVKVVASSLAVRSGPGNTYAFLTMAASGQEFVAFSTSGSWYRIYLPNSNGRVAGWIEGGQSLAVPDPAATLIQVFGTGGAGLLVRPNPDANAGLASWNLAGGISPGFEDCVPRAKIWDGEWFVSSASQSGWIQYDLPANHYFDSSRACGPATSPGPSFGWSSASSLQ
jgi:murein DD-endopeptidase MepM/ murein hydrolase activator NlpD